MSQYLLTKPQTTLGVIPTPEDAYCEIFVPTFARSLAMSVGEFPGDILGVFGPEVFKELEEWRQFAQVMPLDYKLYNAIKSK